MNTLDRVIFSGLQILVQENLQQNWMPDQALVTENGRIKAIIPKNMIQHHLPAKHLEFPQEYYLSPGLIDVHIHGSHGRDVMDASPDSLIAISRALAAEGVTGFLATTMNAEDEHIERVLKAIAETKINDNLAADILGVHLEGAFISKWGAQQKLTRRVDFELLKKWQHIARDNIKIVTLAPELTDAMQFIKALRTLNIIISIGHTDATYAETNAAIAAGCTQATHLFNAMSGIHQRKPGAVTALLLANQIAAEIIVDGIHLHPAIVELILRLKHKEKLLLVTDAIRAKCLPNGNYAWDKDILNVNGNECRLADGTLAGSTLTMPQAIKNIMQFTNCSLADAIEMAAFNPANALGLTATKGSISVGKDADLVVFSNELNVMLTMRAGKVFYQHAH